MKIMIKMNDVIRLLMVSKKINRKNLDIEGLEDLKILFFSYLVWYYNNQNNYIETSKCYKVIYDTLSKSQGVLDK